MDLDKFDYVAMARLGRKPPEELQSEVRQNAFLLQLAKCGRFELACYRSGLAPSSVRMFLEQCDPEGTFATAVETAQSLYSLTVADKIEDQFINGVLKKVTYSEEGERTEEYSHFGAQKMRVLERHDQAYADLANKQAAAGAGQQTGVLVVPGSEQTVDDWLAKAEAAANPHSGDQRKPE